MIGIGAWAIGAAIAFRSSWRTSFDLVSGNGADGRLIIFLHEHLYNVLRGRADLLSPPFFFPQPHVLGYTDSFLLDALPFAALRALGFDPFLAAQVLAIGLSLCAFLASLTILRRYLRLTPAIAIASAALMTFPNNLVFKTTEAHPNFFSLYYVPCIVLMVLWSVEDFPRVTAWSLLRAAFAGLLAGLLFASAFYVAWLFALTVLIALGALAALRGRALLELLRAHPKSIASLTAAALAGFAIGVVPLFVIYLPTLKEISGRSFRDFISFAPFPKDLINVGMQNLAWGWLVERLIGDVPHERALAVTPALTAIAVVLLLRLRMQHRTAPAPWPVVFGGVCIAVWAISWLLTLRVGTFSAFWLPYHLLPGSVAIRAGGRIQLLVHLWLVAGLAVLLQHWLATAPTPGRRTRQWIVAALLIVCLAEQINLQTAGLSRRDELARLAAVPAPPLRCEVFLVDAGVGDRDVANLDAMWITTRIGLPTINGDSGWSPPGWQLAEPGRDYDDAARRWIARMHLTQHACLYQRDSRTWSDFDTSPPTRSIYSPTSDATPQSK